MVASTWHIGVCAFFGPRCIYQIVLGHFACMCCACLCVEHMGKLLKSAEPVEMPFGVLSCWPKEHSVRWSRDSPTVRSVERYMCRPIVNYRNYAKVDVWRQCCLCQITLDTCCIGMWIYESTSAQAKNIKICASLAHATSSQLGKSQQIILLIKWKF